MGFRIEDLKPGDYVLLRNGSIVRYKRDTNKMTFGVVVIADLISIIESKRHNLSNSNNYWHKDNNGRFLTDENSDYDMVKIINKEEYPEYFI